MKNTIKFLAVLVVVFTLNSCDKAKELADVNLNTSITEDYTIQIGENQDNISKESMLSLDNTDTHDYLDKLKTVKITKLTYRFKDFTGNEACNMNVEISTDGTVFETKSFIIKNEVDSGNIFEITDVAKLNAMSTALKNNKEVGFKIEGDTFEGAADFKIEVTATLEIVANPL